MWQIKLWTSIHRNNCYSTAAAVQDNIQTLNFQTFLLPSFFATSFLFFYFLSLSYHFILSISLSLYAHYFPPPLSLSLSLSLSLLLSLTLPTYQVASVYVPTQSLQFFFSLSRKRLFVFLSKPFRMYHLSVHSHLNSLTTYPCIFFPKYFFSSTYPHSPLSWWKRTRYELGDCLEYSLSDGEGKK